MNASHVIKALGISGLLLSVAACEDFTGQDPSNARQEVTQDECIDLGGSSQVDPNTNELVCLVPTAAGSSAGGASTGAAIAAAGAVLVTVFAISNSSSGTR